MSQATSIANDSHPILAGDTPALYERPSVTVDIVLLARSQGELRVLLIRRRHDPFQGFWALPGGFVGIDESLEDAAVRELAEETGMQGVQLVQLHTYGEPKRDPRLRVISVAYGGMLAGDPESEARSGDDATDARWWRVTELPPLAFDHDQIIADALAGGRTAG